MHITGYTISLNNIHLYAYHGVMQQEKEIGAWFTIDLELEMDKKTEISSDELGKTVSYADVYDVVCREMRTSSDLLEHVCTRICTALYKEFSPISGIKITLCKDTPPMGGDRMKASVTLKSTR